MKKKPTKDRRKIEERCATELKRALKPS